MDNSKIFLSLIQGIPWLIRLHTSFQCKACTTTMLVIALLILFVAHTISSTGGGSQGETPCDSLVEKGMCRTDPTYMMQFCKKECATWLESVRKVEVQHVNEALFFELEASNATGSTLSFDRFEGYVTIVTNVAKSCVGGVSEKAYQTYEQLQRVWPYALEIVVFPFEHPDVGYVYVQDCSTHEEASSKEGRSIHVMEMVKINGPNTHPVYKYLKETFSMKEIETDYSTFFLVTPYGDVVEAHHGATLSQLKNAIKSHLDRDL